MPAPIARPNAALLALLALLVSAPASAKDRSAIPDRYKWNLADLYPSEAAWTAAKEDLSRRIPALEKHRGHLGDSVGALRAALDDLFGLRLDLERLYVYASSLSDEDTRAARPRELRQAAQLLAVRLSAAGSWMPPEILALGDARAKAFLAEDPKLAPYRFYVEDVLRGRPHTLSAPEERIASEAGDLADAGQSIAGLLRDADLPWPTVKLSTGEEVRLDTAGFAIARASRAREDRDRAFDEFFGSLRTYERTLGAALYATVKAQIFDAKVHEFPTTLEASLFANDIPPAVYRQLVSDVRRSLPTFHRYLALRKRMLGLEKLRYQDLYVPMVKSVDLRFEPDQARAIVLEALAPLGKPYVDGLRRGFESRWTDYLPSTGKRAGAYSSGVFGVHPIQLLNFNGRYEDLSTLAHESGHSMHTWLAARAQPYPTSGYATFVAEVASTLNENLLVHYMADRATDDATRLAILGSYLDGLRGTLFRQTQFADFELSFHEMAERGETLTGEGLTKRYLELARTYYGHDQGVCQVDDLIGYEWAFVPHFHYGYYVYQYATSLVASTAIARAIREEAKKGKTARRDAYLKMLSAGGSEYPIQLLRDAGVDMTTSKPFDAAIAEMNATMDEMEGILARQQKPRKP
jgi:oligoendopeptidase F